MNILEELAKKEHLGDGCYAHHDGYQIWLTTMEGMAVALDSGTMRQLVEYNERVTKMIRHPRDME